MLTIKPTPSPFFHPFTPQPRLGGREAIKKKPYWVYSMKLFFLCSFIDFDKVKSPEFKHYQRDARRLNIVTQL
jgi:hypothetical protein